MCTSSLQLLHQLGHLKRKEEKRKKKYCIGPLVYLPIIEVDVISPILHFFLTFAVIMMQRRAWILDGCKTKERHLGLYSFTQEIFVSTEHPVCIARPNDTYDFCLG